MDENVMASFLPSQLEPESLKQQNNLIEPGRFRIICDALQKISPLQFPDPLRFNLDTT